MSKINILIVDDRPEGILSVEAVLSSPNYNLVGAASGTEALKCLLKDDFAVILMDVQMPIMNGFETAAVIKTREKSKDIPIIFMSAINQDEQYVYQGYGVGAVDYLLKPFDPYILRSKVSIFVDLYVKNQLLKEQTKKLYESEIKTYSQALDRLELESLRRFQGLADSIPQIVFRFNIDGSGEYFNKKWYEFTGLSQEQSLSSGWRDVYHPEDLNKVIESLSHTQRSGSFEVRIKNKEGNYRWHEVKVAGEFTAETDLVNSWLGTATDIEDRKRTEDSQRFLAEAGALLVSSLDYEGTIQTVAELAVPHIADWCSFDVLADNDIKNLGIRHIDPDKVPMIEKLRDTYMKNTNANFGLNKVLQTGTTQVYSSIDEQLMRDSGLDSEGIMLASSIKDKSALVVPLNVKGKTIGAITLAFSDSGRTYDRYYTEVAEELGRRAALALENSRLYRLSQEAIELRNDFLSIASHELNTPITSLKLQLQMTKKTLGAGKEDQPFPLDKFKRSIDASVKQVDRLINLVQVLLDVSRIQSGKFTFNFQEVNLTDVMHEVIERQNEILANSNCEIDLSIPDNVYAVVDKVRIEQVMVNLLTNAIKYAPGKIKLTMKTDSEFINITFRDHGNGIPAPKLKKIFDRFERATSNESVSGLGLGLYIVKQIIEGHHGDIQVESETGEGTVFTVKLPKNASLHLEENQVTH